MDRENDILRKDEKHTGIWRKLIRRVRTGIWDKLLRRLPFQERRNNIILLLGALSILLLIAAGAIYWSIYSEGDTAARSAQELLNQSGIKPQSTFPDGSNVYVQPEAPEPTASGGADNLLSGELSGYTVIARIDIGKIDVHLPVLSETSTGALKVSVCYYMGPEPGGAGNLVITGHNYKSGAHFGKLDKVKAGDTVLLTDKSGNTHTYTVYKTELIKPDNPEALNQTSYERELTLVTCEASGNRRLLVRCRMA